MKGLLLAALLATPALAARPLPVEVRYVDCVNGSFDNDGLTWATATRNVASAFDHLPDCVWEPGPQCVGVVEVNVAPGECFEPPGIGGPSTTDITFRGAGRDLTSLVGCPDCPGPWAPSLDVAGPYRCIVEGIAAPTMEVWSFGASLEVRDSEVARVVSHDGDLLVENAAVLYGGIGYVNTGVRGSSFVVRDSIIERVGVAAVYTAPGGPGLGVIHLDRNLIVTTGVPAVTLQALDGTRMTAILRDNLLIPVGAPAIETYGRVTVGGNQH